MPAKAPIYLKAGGGKGGNGNGKGGKKLRELLSTDMISPPLGDFRHMAHVGRGGAGDMFGDTNFLQQKLAIASSDVTHSSDNVPKVVAEGLATMRRNGSFGKKGSKKQRNLSTPDENTIKSDVKSLSAQSYDGYGPMESPILQSAFSLPLIPQQQQQQSDSSTPSSPTGKSKKRTKKTKKTVNNNSIANGQTHSEERLPITSTPNPVNVDGPPKPRRVMDQEPDRLGNGLHGKGMPKDKHSPLRRSSDVYTAKPDGVIPASYSDTTSLDEGWSLDLDLGTSLMDDVIGVMDKIEL